MSKMHNLTLLVISWRRSMCLLFVAIVVLLTLLYLPGSPNATASEPWNRFMLAYHDQNRDSQDWKRHLMRINHDGSFTNQWLFNGAILTSQYINGKDLMYASLTSQDLTDLLNQTFRDASALDAAASSLASQFGAPPSRIKVAITMPWLNPSITSIQLGGTTYNLTNAGQRVQAAMWYLDQIKSRAASARWSHLELYGMYYHREDASDAWGDPSFITNVNAQAHARQLKTVWVPYYDAPQAWNGNGLGFDITNVQPSYSFRSALDGGDVNGGRLYSAGFKTAGLGQTIEYELRGQGKTQVENWIAHQYLAVSQLTRTFNTVTQRPAQVFFAGLDNDLFDQISTQATAPGDMWYAYSDLANYLADYPIANMEMGIPWNPIESNGVRSLTWTPPHPKDLRSVRLDFNDLPNNLNNPWQGRLEITVTRSSGTKTAFAVRSGVDDINPAYNSVLVPLPPATNDTDLVTQLTIRMTRENANGAWPNVMRLVAAQYEPTIVANRKYEEISSSTRTIQSGPYADSFLNNPVLTHMRYAVGKLTDTKKSPNKIWNPSDVMGWNMYDGRFSVTIDLGELQSISAIRINAHHEQSAGINLPRNLSATAGTCAPHAQGILGESCLANGTSKAAVITMPTSGTSAGVVTLPMNGVNSRFVTVTGILSGWGLLDEIEVVNTAGTIVSSGKRYTITPKPSVAPGDRLAYGDDSRRLTDGVITSELFGQSLVGIRADDDTAQSVTTTWSTPQETHQAIVWLAKPDPQSGIILPSSVNIAWKDADTYWRPGVNVVPLASCGPAPCAKLTLPAGTRALGIRATFPKDTTLERWFMISEISAQ